jgi:hypothetical protein
MIRTKKSSGREASERQALRRKLKQMYDWFNRGAWEKCFSLLDPKLKKQSKLQLPLYSERMLAFKQVYGSINPWHIRLSKHLDGSSNKHDNRPFAYVYVVWQDQAHGFHMFRERWVKESGRWFTRVMGLVP